MVANKPDGLIYSECFDYPPGNAFDLKAKYEVNGNGSNWVHTMATPLIGDINNDGTVEILTPRVKASNEPWLSNGFIVFNGKTGAVIRDIATVDFQTHGQATAIVDVDGDKKAELFIQASDKKIYCYDPTTGNLKSGFTTTPALDYKQILQLVDINNDGKVELVAGRYIFDAKSGGSPLVTISWPDVKAAYGSPHNMDGSYGYFYNLFTMVDIDGDGDLEQAAGPYVFDIDLSAKTSSLIKTANTTGMNTNAIYGQTMALDFDGDGEIEIVVLGQTRGTTSNSLNPIEIYVYKPLTGTVISRCAWNGTVDLTIPYAGDLDGNGTPEVIFADGNGGTYGMIALTYDKTSNGTA
jgi:hypothetical protein